MILRIFRARLRPGMRGRFARLCRETSQPMMEAQPGLIYFHICRPIPQRPQEFVLITAWKDLESLKRFVGERWDLPVILPGEAPLVEEVSLQHFAQDKDDTIHQLGQGPRIPAVVLQEYERAAVQSLRLSDTQWERVRPLLPQPKREGRPRADDRRTLEGILFVLRVGVRWQDMPAEFGSYVTCWRRYARWVESGVWERVWRALRETLDPRERAAWSLVAADGGFAPVKGNARRLRQIRQHDAG